MPVSAGDVRATLTLDTSKFSEGVTRAQAELSTLTAGGQKVTSAFDQVEGRMNASAAAIAQAMNAAGAGSTRLSDLAGRADQAGTKAELLARRAADAARTLMEAQAAAKKSSDALTLLQESADASAENLQWAEENLKALGASSETTAGQLLKAQAALEEFQAESADLNAQVEKLRSVNEKNAAAAKRAADRYDSLKLQLSGAEGAAERANAKFDALAQTLSGSGQGMSLKGLIDDISTLGSSTLTSASRSLGTIAVNAAGIGSTTAAGAVASEGLGRVLSSLVRIAGPAKLALVGMGGAAVYALHEFYKYKSGAYEAAEAQTEMAETAKEWQAAQAKTVYDTGNDAFAVMGVSESDFSSSVGTAEGWIDSLVRTWTDGKVETDKILNEYVSAFTQGSDNLRAALEQRRQTLAGLGVDDSETLQADLDQLEAWDKEVEALLKKRQNGYLTDDETQRLNTIVQAKAELEVEYGVSDDTDGFDKILQQVQADVARLQALGESPSVDTFADGMKAAALGLNDYKQALSDSYSEQYKLIQGMEDGAAKEQAFKSLNDQYAAQMTEGLQKYAETLSQLYGTVWDSPDVQNGQQGMANIVELVRQYNAASNETNRNSVITMMNEQLSQLDEGALTSYMAVAMQVVDLFNQGMSVEDLSALFPEIDISQMLGGYSTVADFLSAHTGEFEGLEGIFGQGGAVPEELQRVAATLELDTSALDEFLANPVNLKAQWDLSDATIDEPEPVNVLIAAYQQAKDYGMPPDPQVEATISQYKKEGSVTAVDWTASANAVVEYFEDNPDLSYDSEKLKNLTAYVAAYDDTAAEKPTIDPITVDVTYRYTGGVSPASDNTTVEKEFLKDVDDDVDTMLSILRDNPTEAQVELALKFVLAPATEADANTQTQREAMLQALKDAGYIIESELSETGYEVNLSGIGDDLMGGVDEGIQNHDFAPASDTAAANIEEALRAACQTHSPSEMTKPIGTDLTDGVAEGMKNTLSIDAAASVVSNSVLDTMQSKLDDTYSIGSNFTNGLARGILAGRSKVISAAINVATAALAAAKSKMEISSPSKVTEEFGEFFDMGFIRGIENMTPDVERAISQTLDIAPPVDYNSSNRFQRRQSSDRSVPLDYDQLAEAMARIQLNMNYRGRTFAQISAEDTARAQNRRAQGIALGYGKR